MLNQCKTCKHHGRCDDKQDDDCYEQRVPDTEPAPPPEHIGHDDSLFVIEAFHGLKRHTPRRLPRKFTRTLDRVQAMRANL